MRDYQRGMMFNVCFMQLETLFLHDANELEMTVFEIPNR